MGPVYWRYSLFMIALCLGACALPSLPSLPPLPRLSTLLPVISSGATLKEALALALPDMNAWSSGAALLEIQGTKLDSGGRNGGYKDGVWVARYQADAKPGILLSLSVTGQKVSQLEYPDAGSAEQPLESNLSSLLDSPDVLSRAKLSGASFTIILRQQASGPVYNILAESTTERAVMDARTGALIPDS